MVKENKHFLMETFMKVIIDKENPVGKGSIYGKMKLLLMKVSLWKDIAMEKE